MPLRLRKAQVLRAFRKGRVTIVAKPGTCQGNAPIPPSRRSPRIKMVHRRVAEVAAQLAEKVRRKTIIIVNSPPRFSQMARSRRAIVIIVANLVTSPVNVWCQRQHVAAPLVELSLRPRLRAAAAANHAEVGHVVEDVVGARKQSLAPV